MQTKSLNFSLGRGLIAALLITCGASAAKLYPADPSTNSAAPAAALYHEALRPQFHFTAKQNWLNDPNGLVFYKGQYHLFFQHNPSGIEWGNMTWGHAVSKDLLHWTQQAHAIEPDDLGTIFSGSAVVDVDNTSGFGKPGGEPPIVLIYTAAGDTSAASKGKPFTQCLAFSLDAGRTWQKYDHNPVLNNIAGGNRDPKVIWHAPTKKWVMALFLDGEHYALFGSENLRQWTKLSDVPSLGASECPDMFPLSIAVANAEGQSEAKWIFWGGNGNYLIGSFDGTRFTADGPPLRFEYGANYYAAQTYSDIPKSDGRRIQIGWMRGGKYPQMPFNQQMSVPSELTLQKTPAGLRLCRNPIRELDSLHDEHHQWHGELKPGADALTDISGDTFDIKLEADVAHAKSLSLKIRGAELSYDPKSKQLRLMDQSAAAPLNDSKLSLRILVDRTSIEVFAGAGEITLSSCYLPSGDLDHPLRLSGDSATVNSLDTWRVKSCWPSSQ